MRLNLSAETIEVRPGESGRFVVMEADDEPFYLSPIDCIELSRALVRAAGDVLGLPRNPKTPAVVGQGGEEG